MAKVQIKSEKFTPLGVFFYHRVFSLLSVRQPATVFKQLTGEPRTAN